VKDLACGQQDAGCSDPSPSASMHEGCVVFFHIDSRRVSREQHSPTEPQHQQSSPRGTPQNSAGIGVGLLFSTETCNISEMGQDRTKVTIDD